MYIVGTMKKSLIDEFREIRRVATPWCCIQTVDFRATIRELSKVRIDGEAEPVVVAWNCVDGPVVIQGTADIGTKDDAPSVVIQKSIESLPAKAMLFVVIADTFAEPGHFWTNPFTIQAAANVRDEFKSNRRTLVFLSVDGKLPSLFSDDVPVLKDELPSEADIAAIAKGLVDDVNKELSEVKKKPLSVSNDTLARAAGACRGMTRFAAEEALSRNLSGKAGINVASLMSVQRLVIERTSDRVLTFERGSETFEDIGGLEQVKRFSRRLFAGKRPPRVVVRIEEIEKAMAGIGSVGAGDSTGTSQDQLGVLLGCMEDYHWTGLIAFGLAGSGKSLLSKAMGNSNGAMTLNLDLGAAKSRWLGDSEGRIRKSMDIVHSVGGSDVLFVATSNGLDGIPPELRRRFKFGVWFFDLLSSSERQAVWEINLRKYGLDDGQEKPDDTDWVGSDIRNVCDLADRLQCSVVEAAEFIVPVAKSSPDAVQKLRNAAHGKFLSASERGVYMKPESRTARMVQV